MIFKLLLLQTGTVGTCQNRLDEAVLTSAHNLCFGAKIRNKMYIPVKPNFPYIKRGFQGCLFHRLINRMCIVPSFSPILIPFVNFLSPNAVLISNLILILTNGSHYLLTYMVSYETLCTATQEGISSCCLWEYPAE